MELKAPFGSKIICKIFGHKAPKYYKQPSYGRVKRGAIDGIGRVHCDVIANCDRCYQDYVIIKIHLKENE